MASQLKPPFRNVIDRAQEASDQSRYGQLRPEGTNVCIECRKDTPIEELTEEDSKLGIRGQLCPKCHKVREHRLKKHARRIRRNLRRIGFHADS